MDTFFKPHWCVTQSCSFTSCVLDMKVVWWLFPFYCISPRVIAVSSLLLKPCQSGWAKWQPSGNRITGRRGSQESPSSDLLAKQSDCMVMSSVWRQLFFYSRHSSKSSNAKSTQLMLGTLVSMPLQEQLIIFKLLEMPAESHYKKFFFFLNVL